ncbi:MAG TPA: 2-phosphosulfolactate phosphatase [Ktedonobacterales bacterium]
MEIQRIHRRQAAEARGVVVVIDVIRAFSVAAYGFAGGACALWLVRTVEEALALRERKPDAALIGEVGGRLIPGFDYNNSPAAMSRADVRGRTLIQRTGAGTQGAVDATGADALLLAALVNAQATATHARAVAEQGRGVITLMSTAAPAEDGEFPAIEDDICADYVEALLQWRDDAAEVLAAGLARLRDCGRLSVFERAYPDFPADDVPAFLAVDRFTFAMPCSRERWRGIEYVTARRLDVVEAL